MKSTTTVDQIRELLDREARGDFGPDGLGQDLQWLADNWAVIRTLRLGAFKAVLTSDKFDAKISFVVNTSSDAPVKISYLGDNFRDWFLRGEEKIEKKSSKRTNLRHFDLKKPMKIETIIKKLGGKEKAVVDLSDVFAKMEEQPNGENGELLTNGFANIFIIYDQNGVLRAVSVSWGGGGWLVSAQARLWFRVLGTRAAVPSPAILESSLT